MKSIFSRILALSLVAAIALGALLPQTASALATEIKPGSVEPRCASMAELVGTKVAHAGREVLSGRRDPERLIER